MKALLRTLACSMLLFSISSLAAAHGASSDFYRRGSFRVQGDTPSYLDIGLGIFDFDGDESEYPGAGRLELRWGRKFLFVGPMIGLLANFNGGSYAYGGIYTDIAWGRVFLTPAVAAGGYEKGESKDLGGNLQFRSSLGAGFEFDDLSRLGIQASHISNADLDNRNPGEEDILFTLSVPLDF